MFIHSFHNCFSSTYSFPAPVPGAGDLEEQCDLAFNLDEETGHTIHCS